MEQSTGGEGGAWWAGSVDEDAMVFADCVCPTRVREAGFRWDSVSPPSALRTSFLSPAGPIAINSSSAATTLLGLTLYQHYYG